MLDAVCKISICHFWQALKFVLHPVDCKTRDSWLLRSIILKWHDWRFQIAKKKTCVFYRRCLLCIQGIYVVCVCVCVCWFGWLVVWLFVLMFLFSLVECSIVCLFDWLFDCLNWQVFLLPATFNCTPLAAGTTDTFMYWDSFTNTTLQTHCSWPRRLLWLHTRATDVRRRADWQGLYTLAFCKH